MKPYHQHDCEKCQYLGSTHDLQGGPHDWYVCGDTVLARYSSDGPDYWSMLASIVREDSYLEAWVQAEERKVLVAMFIVARFMLNRRRNA